MLNEEDEVFIEEKSSSSREEVIAKLLGWLQGTRRRPLTEVTLEGISAEQLPNMHSLGGETVMDLLRQQRRSAHTALALSADAKDSTEIIDAKAMEIAACDELIDKAQTFFEDFDDEIENGELSVIKIAKKQSEDTGITHYTNASVDAWSIQKYKRSIRSHLNSEASTTQESPDTGIKSEEIEVEVDDVANGLSRTIATNLYITFALLVENLAQTNKGKCFHSDGRPNVANIVTLIQELVVAENTKHKGTLPGQSAKTLQTHVAKAVAAKREAIK